MSDIEDIVSNSKNILFVKELVKYDFNSDKDFLKKHTKVRSNLRICPSKPILRKIYNQLIIDNEIERNPSFLKYSLKKKARSSSGVSVITVLTSPTPEYTDKDGNKVKQSFSCGKNCAYCPNEPEIKLNLKVKDISPTGKQIKVITDDDIHLIRTLSYIIHNNNIHEVEQCSHFKDTNFIFQLYNKIDTLQIGDNIIGVKIEQPRSYLSSEPAVLRANRNKFDPILQMYDRADALINCGHEVDKIEVLVLGGTWDHYPIEYQNEFIRDIYYSVNTLDHRGVPKASLKKEIEINKSSSKRLIGLTLETRPDCINLRQIKKLREFNVTRLQIGVQHIDDDILTKIERGCFTADTIKGNNLWKQNGGKVDWHLMPDLPGSSIQKDINMFEKIFGINRIDEISKNYFKYELTHPELQADQLKIYPCSVVDWTKIKEWYETGSYKPYSENEEDLIKVIAFIKNNIFPWIRLNRIIRDIPNLNIIGGNENVNLRQKLLTRKDINCQCIRCREVKDRTQDIHNAELFIREYNGVNSREFFISYESPDQQILYGFLRLRLNDYNDDLIYKELYGCALIRELHVYGTIVKHDIKKDTLVQHQGFGKKLLEIAENISYDNNYDKMAIISGVGVREYYENRGYTLLNNYMIKEFKITKNFPLFEYIILSTILVIIISIFYDIYYI